MAYLLKNYLTFQSKFEPSIWSGYSALADFQGSKITTNSIESLNKRLKAACPNGKISYQKSIEILYNFKCEMMELYHFTVTHNNLNRQRPDTIRRKIALQDIMAVFQHSDLSNPQTLCDFAVRFGTYDSSNLPEIPCDLTVL